MRAGACCFGYLGLLLGCAVDTGGIGTAGSENDGGGDRSHQDSPPGIDGPAGSEGPQDAGVLQDGVVTDLPAVDLLPLPDAKVDAPAPRHSMRFFGNGLGDIDRVKIAIDNATNSLPGPPADVGITDFTFEFWMKAAAADNRAGPLTCGSNFNVAHGNMIADRDRMNQGRVYAVAIADGRIVFGAGTDNVNLTLCGKTPVLDSRWHHVAAQRRRLTGQMTIHVDGKLDAEGTGPAGDISYPDDGSPRNDCNGPCRNDIYLALGADKFDTNRTTYPPYSGFLDELRLSTTLRYTAAFLPPTGPFGPDASTAALYHFDEGAGDVVADSSGAIGGPSNGFHSFGGTPAGPVWSTETPFP